jgi:sporulation protein YlmC with PRC-barrel domain
MEAAKRPRELAASILKGDEVINAKGEDLGAVQEIMIDLERGRVAYVVLSFDHVNWMPNDKLFAVPWEFYQYQLKIGSSPSMFLRKPSNLHRALTETNGLMWWTLPG